MIVPTTCAYRAAAAFLVLLAARAPVAAAPKPVPPSPYLGVAYRYADAMLTHGRDSQGPQQTGLLLSALDRVKQTALTERPAAPAGVPESLRAGGADGPLAGANPLHDQNVLRLLYTLADLSSKPLYRNAADAELKWFLENAAPADAPRAAWDEDASWDVGGDKLIRPADGAAGGFSRSWLLWDRSFELAPEAGKRLVAGLSSNRGGEAASPRRTGFSIRAFAVAYQHSKDDACLKAVENALDWLEKQQSAGTVRTDSGRPSAGSLDNTSAAWLSAAIDCGGAAPRVPPPLATRLRTLATKIDQQFCALPHDLKGKGGFALQSRPSIGKSDGAFTPIWQADFDQPTTAQVAMMCVSRYENTGDVRYRELIRLAADAYGDQLPAADVDVWPMTFGLAISLELAAWRSTARQEYLDRARTLADAAVETFWGDNALPRASARSGHYESITGSGTLGLALVELHLSILHITAVRCPPNTIDR